MKIPRTLLTLLTGVTLGVAAHTGWFALRRPKDAASLETQLVWMSTLLRLDEEQFVRFKALHEEYESQRVQLASRLERVLAASSAFEQQRRTVGEIDFLQFAQMLAERRALDRTRTAYTRRLITAAVAVMTPEQRAQYLELVAPAFPASPPEAAY